MVRYITICYDRFILFFFGSDFATLGLIKSQLCKQRGTGSRSRCNSNSSSIYSSCSNNSNVNVVENYMGAGITPIEALEKWGDRWAPLADWDSTIEAEDDGLHVKTLNLNGLEMCGKWHTDTS